MSLLMAVLYMMKLQRRLIITENIGKCPVDSDQNAILYTAVGENIEQRSGQARYESNQPRRGDILVVTNYYKVRSSVGAKYLHFAPTELLLINPDLTTNMSPLRGQQEIFFPDETPPEVTCNNMKRREGFVGKKFADVPISL